MCVIDDFGNVIEQHLKLMRLVPTATHFKCRGVHIGVMTHHFIKSWAEMTHGILVSIPLFVDRTIPDIRFPNSPKFHYHIQ
ncbi:hypothetical protein CUMW_267130 [Citrus unshiu]|uniref:Uncharacterized protein n=1 Tax=Citrus unshiu TaxID=55188 RepID=A0A2H5QW12_CITUN|nr:hypothetical protein CUMW_267130 [Citrus unshiu]